MTMRPVSLGGATVTKDTPRQGALQVETPHAEPGESMSWVGHIRGAVSHTASNLKDGLTRWGARSTAIVCLALAGCATAPAYDNHYQPPTREQALHQAGQTVGQVRNTAVNAYQNVRDQAVESWHAFMGGLHSTDPPPQQ